MMKVGNVFKNENIGKRFRCNEKEYQLDTDCYGGMYLRDIMSYDYIEECYELYEIVGLEFELIK